MDLEQYLLWFPTIEKLVFPKALYVQFWLYIELIHLLPSVDLCAADEVDYVLSI